MSNVVPASPAIESTHPPAIALREVWPWALFVASVLVVALFVVGSFQGSGWLHEFAHDGRHLLSFPCH